MLSPLQSFVFAVRRLNPISWPPVLNAGGFFQCDAQQTIVMAIHDLIFFSRIWYEKWGSRKLQVDNHWNLPWGGTPPAHVIPCSFKLSRWILMAISTPSLVLARWTCPSDAAASGWSSNSAKSSPDRRAPLRGESAHEVCTQNGNVDYHMCIWIYYIQYMVMYLFFCITCSMTQCNNISFSGLLISSNIVPYQHRLLPRRWQVFPTPSQWSSWAQAADKPIILTPMGTWGWNDMHVWSLRRAYLN